MKNIKFTIFVFSFLLAQFAFADSENTQNSEISTNQQTTQQIQTDTTKESIFFDGNQIKPKTEQKYYSGEVGVFAVAGVNTHTGDAFYAGDVLVGGGIYSNLETANPYAPNWHLGFYAVNTVNPNQLEFLTTDSVLYWNVIPKRIDFVKLDLGAGIRFGNKITIIATSMFYIDLDFNIPNTGLHFNLLSKNGLFPDFTNQDIKLSLAYDFNLSKIKLGVEAGYNFWMQIPIFSEKDGFLTSSAYLALYAKW